MRPFINAVSKHKKPVTWTESLMQRALALQLDYVRHCIVPNVSLGNTDEMDLAVLTPSLILCEVEVKISMADWARDNEKEKWTLPIGELTPSRFYYAVPDKLVNKDGKFVIPEWVQPHAGIITVVNRRSTTTMEDGSQVVVDKPVATIRKFPKPRHRNRLPEKYIYELYRKLSIRYWAKMFDKGYSKTITFPEE